MLFYHKVTTPRDLSTIELRVNGLVISKQPQLLSTMQAGEAIAEKLPSGKWSLLIIHRGACDAVCTERVAPVASMLGQLPLQYREKTRLTLVADDVAELVEIIKRANQNEREQETIHTITMDKLQRQYFEDTIANIIQPKPSAAWPEIIIVDDAGRYRGYFTAPFDVNKMLLTYSSVIEHR